MKIVIEINTLQGQSNYRLNQLYDLISNQFTNDKITDKYSSLDDFWNITITKNTMAIKDTK